MNPLFMQMMMNPMGMGFSPFLGSFNFMMPSLLCGSNFMMSMPYYQNDNLWFLNQPIYRNTSYDYLLDPNLALQQCQYKWQNGGGFGSTMLPGFTFPSISPISPISAIPGFPGGVQQPAKTEAEKEAEKKQENESKKPAAKKAQKLNETFDKIKKLAEDQNNHFPEISEELSKKAEEAMKKGTADEQYQAMKEVLAAIPAETLRKTILTNDNVRNQLRKAGYNFNLAGNAYSLKNNDISNQDIDHADRLRKLHSDIVEKKYNELQIIAGQLSDPNVAKSRILGVISAWNDRFKNTESGILRVIGANLPTGNDAVAKTDAVQECTKVITEALLIKADEFEGCAKITKAREEVSKNLDAILQPNGFNQANINKLAESFDKLYARLRMQEAVNINNYLKRNFSYLNEVKDGTITDKMVIEETQKDLELEGLRYPKTNELDIPSITEDIIVQTEQEMQDLDEQYVNDGEEMLKALVSRGDLTPSPFEGVYQTKNALPGGQDRVRYFKCFNDKVYEVFKTTVEEDGQQVTTFSTKENRSPVTAKEIGNYTNTLERINKLYKDKALDYAIWHQETPVFQATGATNEKYFIKNGNLYHIINTARVYEKTDENNITRIAVDFKDGRTEIYLEDLLDSDIEAFNDNEITTKKQAEERKRTQKANDVAQVEALQYTSLKELDCNTELDKISEEICGEKGHFRNCKNANGYFISDKPHPRFYKYNIKTGKLEYVKNIRKIYKTGYAEDFKGKLFPIDEIFMDKEYTGVELINKIQEYGSDFRTLLNGRTSDEEVKLAHKKLNTIIAINDPMFTINFIKGYKNNDCLWSSDDMCCQIVKEWDFDIKIGSTTLSRSHYVQQIAILIKNVVDTVNFDRNSEDYKNLCKIANGETMSGIAAILDKIIDKTIEAYDKKYGEQ